MTKSLAYGIATLLLLSACTHSYTPKERGLPRIKFPEKRYHLYKGLEPLIFSIPAYATIVPVKNQSNNVWFNIHYDTVQAVLYVSFQSHLSKQSLKQQIEVGKRLAMEHAIKATSIRQKAILIPSSRVYGLFYTLEGNTASPLQFFLTDSVTHYIRGALYFNKATKRDSVQPVIDFLERDLFTMIESLRWK